MSGHDVAVSIPIRAPVSDDMEDDATASFGSSEEEADFESASERMGASPAGSPTFWYTQTARGRPSESRNADPLADRGASEVWPLARVKQPLPCSFSFSSAVLVQPTMPVAKLSGDDDDDGGDSARTDEEEVFQDVVVGEDDEDEGDGGDFSRAKVPPYSLFGGLRVAGSDSDQILKNADDGQPGTLEESLAEFHSLEAYPKAVTETLQAMETRPGSWEERTEGPETPTAEADVTLEESAVLRIANEGALGLGHAAEADEQQEGTGVEHVVESAIVQEEVAGTARKDGIEEIPSEGYESKQESSDRGDAVAAADGLLNSNAQQEGAAEQEVIECGKKGGGGPEVQEAKEGGSGGSHSGQGGAAREDGAAKMVPVGSLERNSGGETNEAKVVATVHVGASENCVIQQEGTDKEGILGDGSFMGSDSLHEDTAQDEVIMAGEKGGPDDTEGAEELKLLNFADGRPEEGVGPGVDSPGCQNVGEFKQGSQMPGSLKSTEDKESEGTGGGSDAGRSVEVDDAPRPNPEQMGRVVNPQTGFSLSGDRDMAGKAVLDKALLGSDNRAQFEFEPASVDDQYVQNVDGGLIANWDEEADDDDEEEEDDEDEEMVDSSALAALMEAARSAGTGSNNASLGAAVPPRPMGLGSSVPSLEPTPRPAHHVRSNGSASARSPALVEDSQHNGDSDDGCGETQEKLQMLRVKFLRLVQRLGQSPQNVVVTQVLYRLGLAEGLRRGRIANRASGFDRARAVAEQQEAAGLDLDFICNIMVLGKTGVGKSATINSLFDEMKSATDAFQPATNKVQEVLGTIHGIKVRVIDTPGLMPSFADQHRNKSILSSVKKFVRKFPPDIVLYFDRLDMQSRDYSDIPLLKNITDTFGASIWFNAIVVLTHASSAPPDGRDGAPLSYEMFVAHRSQVVQHSIRQAAGDMRLMNPVSLVENHSSCRTNREGQRVLPNGQIWKPQLLLLCFASKILAEANSLLKLQDSTPGRLFGVRTRGPPLPFLLSSLLQSRAQLKILDEQGGEEVESDDDFEDLTDSEDGDEYDRLPPFKHLRKSQLSKLTKEQRKAYFDEVDYREKLFQKKQWKEALRRRRNMKKMPRSYKDESQATGEDFDEGSERAASVAVPMPDMAMPLTFDSDNPAYRYRYLETASQWLVRPVLDTHGWDHDTGYDGLNVEKIFVIGNKVPASISGQITKDKKEGSLQLECAASVKHGEHKTTLAGFDVQTVGKDLAYTLRSETRFSNFKCNKTTGGLALTLLGDTLATGLKLEDGLMIGKRLKLIVNGGAMMGRGNVAYGGSLEATLRDKDYPIGQMLTTLGLSVMQWHGDLAIGGNLQSQIAVGRKMTIVTRANLNNKGSGQITIRTTSSEQLQIALIGIIPIIRTLIGGRLFGQSHSTQ